ncbi:cellulose synthase-like protein E6 isoform X2 [Argentina anserina]|uniref:cellulose synthase-like protein E6 isoform X2 n=1 Tax=Argentina anserina TaxID=57926 RepID=UPI00217658A8|nr:cellulose synthase-like protein E6 isoform X2 [Potentilla anserina]
MGEEKYLPLFATTRAKGRVLYRLFAVSVFIGICLICVYRVSHIPKASEDGRFGWMYLFAAELWFSFYWFLTQATRWSRVYRQTFKERLSLRYEKELPGVDIFVCTADPIIEPPMMVMNTVLSVMAYDYPPEKFSVYLSDDGGSELTYYALLEAAEFAKHWIPYCKKYRVEPRSPAAYFVSTASDAAGNNRSHYQNQAGDSTHIKKLYENMENKVESAVKLGRVSEDVRSKHKGFSRWDSYMSKRDHDTILQIVVDGRNPNGRDVEGCVLPTLVYLAREKRPQYHHNFKAGAINALVELHGLDNYGGPMYIGTGCFHRRDTLCGRIFTKGCKSEMKWEDNKGEEIDVHGLEETSKSLASCIFEENTQWGKEMGLKYGCPVEDVITGLSIQCRGWKSVYCNPKRKAFLGLNSTTLLQILLQHKRWSEGNLQIMLSKYSPVWYGHGKISLGLRLGYLRFNLWAANCWATLIYSTLPSLYLLRGTSLFPQISSRWIIPFAYVIIARNIGSFVEYMWCGGTMLGWWNDQRIWFYQRITSYLFAFIDTIVHYLGYTDSAFVITAKVADEDVSERYEKEMMEFGGSSPMFTVLGTVALLNLSCFAWFVKAAITKGIAEVYETMCLQILICVVLIIINKPLYEALYQRKDKGKLPSSVAFKSMAFAGFACLCLGRRP